MSLSTRLRAYLEKLYNVNFDVSLQPAGKEPQLLVVPARSNQALFSILMKYQNGIRLSMELRPQQFSAGMVRTMGNSTPEQKNTFVSICKLMQKDGAKITFRINDTKEEPTDWNAWPQYWTKLDMKVTIIPIDFSGNDEPDYESTSLKWGSLMMGCVLSLLQVQSVANEEAGEISGKREGNCTSILTNRYERNRVNRMLCLKQYGYTCKICGFDFEAKYGELGKEYIHVHHVVPVSRLGENYVIDPIHDLIPVCPNCHAMLHRCDPPLQPEELKKYWD